MIDVYRSQYKDDFQKLLESFDFKRFNGINSLIGDPCYHFNDESDFVEVHLGDSVRFYRISGYFLSEYQAGVAIEFAYDTAMNVTKMYFDRKNILEVIES